jgi:hypothetical protein
MYQAGFKEASARTACDKCTSTGDANGAPIQLCPLGTQAAWCDRTQKADSQGVDLGQNCVKCLCCNTDYYTSSQSCKTNCYT